MATALDGFGELLRLNLRRDRIMLPIWFLVMIVSAAGSAQATVDLYPDQRSRVQAAALIDSSAALRAMYGRIYDYTSLGAISLVKMTGFGAIFVAVLAIFLVIRHTRADEEVGRTELVAAGSVGRYAALAAALVEAAAAALLLGLLTALSLIAVGLETTGSLAFGALWAVTGIAFAGIAAVAAQASRSARAARGLAITVLVAAYVLRGLGDAAHLEWPVWLSPMGWAEQIRPFAGDRFAVALLLLALAAVAVVAAVRLLDRRDLGAGLIPDRPGPATAAPTLAGPLALAWRLNRSAVMWWTIGFAVLGLLLGSVVSSIGDALGNDRAREFIEKLGGVSGIVDGFVSTELGFLTVFASAFAISVIGRLSAEESATRSEDVLAAGVSRSRLLGAHLTVALLGVTLLVLVLGLMLGVSHSASVGDWSNLGRDLGAAAARLPAAYVVVALAALSYGLLRSMVWAWALLGLFTFLGVLGDLLRLPQWVQDLSPYSHVPSLPGGTLDAAPLAGLVIVALALGAVAFAAFRRRDLSPA